MYIYTCNPIIALKYHFYSDGVLRVFSCAPERQAPAEEQQAFLDSLASSNIPSQIGDVKTDDLLGPEALLNPGTVLCPFKAHV